VKMACLPALVALVPKLCLGTPDRETLFRCSAPQSVSSARNRVSRKRVPKQRLGTRLQILGTRLEEPDLRKDGLCESAHLINMKSLVSSAGSPRFEAWALARTTNACRPPACRWKPLTNTSRLFGRADRRDSRKEFP